MAATKREIGNSTATRARSPILESRILENPITNTDLMESHGRAHTKFHVELVLKTKASISQKLDWILLRHAIFEKG